MKPTKKWLKKQIEDEKKSAIMYRKRGFKDIAKDETKHKRMLERKLFSMKGRHQYVRAGKKVEW